MKTTQDNSPKDRAIVNPGKAEVEESKNPMEAKYDKPGREEDPDTTKKDPEWDKPQRENDNDKTRHDEDSDKTGSDDDADATQP
jgi:hypothetical protein